MEAAESPAGGDPYRSPAMRAADAGAEEVAALKARIAELQRRREEAAGANKT
jgi:hypothetical protein